MSRTGEPLGPYWLERQLDPESPDFQPGAPIENLTHRDWVQLGTISTPERAVVDPRGLVTPLRAGFSLDWWIGADDRWHVPAREVGVRQSRLHDAPIIETVMKVPGGDAVHRAYAVQDVPGPLIVVELENRTTIPFAVALAVVPYNPLGRADVRRIELRDLVVSVDGASAVALSKPPARTATGCIDVLATVVAGEATAPGDGVVVECNDGRAQVAMVFPLPHTAVLRVALPMHRRDPAVAPMARLSTTEEVGRGWDAQAARLPRVAMPDDRFQRTFDTVSRDLLLHPVDGDVLAWPGDPLPIDAIAASIGALDLIGLHDEAEQCIVGLFDEQRSDGSVGSADDNPLATGVALHAVGRHWQLTGREVVVQDLIAPIAKAGHWIDKRRRARRRPLVREATFADLAWCVSGLETCVLALRAGGQPDVADDFATFARHLIHDVEKSAGTAAPSALVAARLGVWPGTDHRLNALADQIARAGSNQGLVVDPGGFGLSPRLTAELATYEMLTGRRAEAAAHIIALLDRGSPVGTWPEVVHPRSGGGSHGSGHDPGTIASLIAVLRTMLVHDRVSADAVDLALCNVVPDSWLGQSWDVHDLPTAAGRLGFAIRWHGDRPALLWEIDRHDGAPAVRLRAPGLDPDWSTTASSGEALLAPVAVPDRQLPDDGGAEASSSFA